MLKIPGPLQVRKHQLLLASGLSMIVVIVVGGFIYLFDGPVDRQKQGKASNAQAFEIESGGKRVSAEEMWRYKMEDDQKKAGAQLQELKNIIEEAVKPRASEELRVLEEKITSLEAQLNYQRANPEIGHEEAFPQQGFSGQDAHAQQPALPQIQKITLKLEGDPRASKTPIKTVDNTIPAGAFAKAVLLGGVDASTAMTSASDPRPVLLRILDQGNLPRRFKSDLQDCHCIASAYGDLSSERVYLRLEKLTCTERTTGEIIETQVAGYVAGEDGRAGIRGTVVSKDLSYLQNSLIGGVFSGFSKTMSPQARQSLVNPFSAGNPKIDSPSTGDLFKSGMAEGGSTALDRLSQYYIDRAEQLQPVVQVAAGRKVDVVFTEGTSIGESEVKKAIAGVRDKARLEAAEKASQRQASQYEITHGINQGSYGTPPQTP